MKVSIILLSIALVILLFNSCSNRLPKNSKTLLFESRIRPWKIYYVKKYQTLVGHAQPYFEVYFNNIKLILPKELTGGIRDIDQFVSASGFESSATQNDTVLIVFEGFAKKENGSEERAFVTVLARAPTNKGELTIYNLCNNRQAQLSIEP